MNAREAREAVRRIREEDPSAELAKEAHRTIVDDHVPSYARRGLDHFVFAIGNVPAGIILRDFWSALEELLHGDGFSCSFSLSSLTVEVSW